MLDSQPTTARARPNPPMPPRPMLKAPEGDVFVGRAGELDELEHLLAGARAGRGATVLIAGRRRNRQDPARSRARRACSCGRLRGAARALVDLVGTGLAYQPFVEALRPLGDPRQVDECRSARSCGSSRRRSHCSASARMPSRCCSCSRTCTGRTPRRSTSPSSSRTTSIPDGSCCLRPTAPTTPSATRMRHLADRVRRSGAALGLELGPLARDELTALLEARTDAPLRRG